MQIALKNFPASCVPLSVINWSETSYGTAQSSTKMRATSIAAVLLVGITRIGSERMSVITAMNMYRPLFSAEAQMFPLRQVPAVLLVDTIAPDADASGAGIVFNMRGTFPRRNRRHSP